MYNTLVKIYLMKTVSPDTGFFFLNKKRQAASTGAALAAGKSAAGKELLRRSGMAIAAIEVALVHLYFIFIFLYFFCSYFSLCFLFNEGSSIDLAGSESWQPHESAPSSGRPDFQFQLQIRVLEMALLGVFLHGF